MTRHTILESDVIMQDAPTSIILVHVDHNRAYPFATCDNVYKSDDSYPVPMASAHFSDLREALNNYEFRVKANEAE